MTYNDKPTLILHNGIIYYCKEFILHAHARLFHILIRLIIIIIVFAIKGFAHNVETIEEVRLNRILPPNVQIFLCSRLSVTVHHLLVL